ncbi:MAG: L,D-transpeptidase family protein [Thermodesulfovibrio sp.]
MKCLFSREIGKTFSFLSLLCLFLYFEGVAYANSQRVTEKCNPKDFYCLRLNELLKSLDYQKIWNNKRIGELENLIDHSKYEGLNPDRYLRELKRINRDDELRLTKILIKLAYHTYYGVVSPSKVFERWDFPRKEDRVIKTLATLVREDRLKDLFKELSPKHEEYLQLKEEFRKILTLEGKDIKGKIQIKAKLRLGDVDEQIPLVKNKLRILGFFDEPEESPYFNQRLKQAIENFQKRHNLEVDGVIGKSTVQALNMSIAERVLKIKINLEKYRWLPEDLGERYILVNIPSYELKFIDKGKTVLESAIIVGKNYREDFRPTPLLFSKITQVVINPDWYVPQKIATKDILPRIKKNPQYAVKDKIRIYQDSKEIDPLEVDWSQYSEDNFPFKLVQKSGNRNALGKIKFHMSNNFDVYLHDTPDKRLFNHRKRAFSSGCIRVEKAYDLATALMQNNTLKEWNEERLKEVLKADTTYHINLKTPIPVYILYFTTVVKSSELIFFDDIYDYDKIISSWITKGV